MTEHKICSKCFTLKPNTDFYKNKKFKDGLRSSCIECSKQYKLMNSGKIKEQIKKYNEKRKEQKKEWAINNKNKVSESRKKWASNNKDKRAEYLKKYNKKYYLKNKDNRYEYFKQKKKEYQETSPLYRMRSNLRSRIKKYLKHKSKSTEEILGISYSEFIIYFENKFTQGMSWDLIGKHIHIDHIIPLSSAKTEEDLIKLCHYTNLQPLWAEDNLKKSNKVL